MSKVAYGVIGGVYRKFKKSYGIVDGVSRKIKKAYSIIGGVARPCWAGGGTLAYYGTTTNGLRSARNYLAAASNGTYALFGGGSTADPYDPPFNTVDAYNEKLTRSSPTGLYKAVDRATGGHIGDYAIIASGSTEDGSTPVFNFYNKSLTRTYKSGSQHSDGRSTNIGDYALFGGGEDFYWDDDIEGWEWYINSTISCVNSSCSIVYCDLRYERIAHAATTVGGYALFGGGYGNEDEEGVRPQWTRIEGVDSSLTVDNTVHYLSQARCYLSATTIGDYALFAGGEDEETSEDFNIVEAYNSSLTRTIITPLSVARCDMLATTIRVDDTECAVFMGGSPNPTTVDAYDTSLTRTSPIALPRNRYDSHAITTIGRYALVGGGTTVVDAFTLV